jgi:hypothetical protein
LVVVQFVYKRLLVGFHTYSKYVKSEYKRGKLVGTIGRLGTLGSLAHPT